MAATAATHEGLLYGRITTDDGAIYEGRLRWGGDEEALWSNYFNGFKDVNPWVAHAPVERLPNGIELDAYRGLGVALVQCPLRAPAAPLPSQVSPVYCPRSGFRASGHIPSLWGRPSSA